MKKTKTNIESSINCAMCNSEIFACNSCNYNFELDDEDIYCDLSNHYCKVCKQNGIRK